MLALIFRVLIIIVVFLAGTLVGNIYMPQKQLEQANIVALTVPKTYLDLDASANTEQALKNLALLEGAAQTAKTVNAEDIYTWQNSIKTALLLQAYKGAKSRYELQIFRMQYNSQDSSAFLKAKDNFAKACSIVQTTAPVKSVVPVDIIKLQKQPAQAQPNLTAAPAQQPVLTDSQAKQQMPVPVVKKTVAKK